MCEKVEKRKTAKQAEKKMKFNTGSLTVEAALVFPFFIMVLYAALCISQLLITEQEIHSGLLETARYAAKYKYVENKAKMKQEEAKKESTVTEKTEKDKTFEKEKISDEKKTSEKENISDEEKTFEKKSGQTVLNSIVLKARFVKNVDNSRLALISGGAYGVSLAQSDLEGSDNVIILRAKAQCKIPVLFFGTYSVTLQETVKQKAFLGYNDENDFQNGEYVYVAENGKVYHTDLNCSHIALKIIPVSRISEITAKRYCQICMKDGKLTGDYVTLYGDCIHNDMNCSGLKRTIRLVKKEQINGLPLCSRCGNGG